MLGPAQAGRVHVKLGMVIAESSTICQARAGPPCLRDLHASVSSGDAPAVVFKLTDNEYTRGMWNYPFEATYTVTLGADALETEFKVMNTGSSTFEFTGALHSYWSVSAIANLKIAGAFDGATFLDKMAEPPAKATCDSAVLDISKPTDSVFEQVGGEGKLLDSGRNTALTISSEGWAGARRE